MRILACVALQLGCVQSPWSLSIAGYHYYRSELDAMEDPEALHARRGAHWTFNAGTQNAAPPHIAPPVTLYDVVCLATAPANVIRHRIIGAT